MPPIGNLCHGFDLGGGACDMTRIPLALNAGRQPYIQNCKFDFGSSLGPPAKTITETKA
jgi:hypothetical protein